MTESFSGTGIHVDGLTGAVREIELPASDGNAAVGVVTATRHIVTIDFL